MYNKSETRTQSGDLMACLWAQVEREQLRSAQVFSAGSSCPSTVFEQCSHSECTCEWRPNLEGSLELHHLEVVFRSKRPFHWRRNTATEAGNNCSSRSCTTLEKSTTHHQHAHAASWQTEMSLSFSRGHTTLLSPTLHLKGKPGHDATNARPHWEEAYLQSPG